MDTTIIVTDSMLDTIIRTNARDMYRAEYWAMAMELKSARAALNRREDMSISSPGDLDPVSAGNWANSIRSRMRAQRVGDVLIIPGFVENGQFTQWEIRRSR